MTVAYNKFNCFEHDKQEGKHNLASDTIKVALTNTAPVATQTVFDPVTNHAAPVEAHGYTAGGHAFANVTSTEAAGTAKVEADKVTITASGGQIGPFRYAVVYNDTSATDPLICWFDYGSSITLNDGESLDVKLNNEDTDGTLYTAT